MNTRTQSLLSSTGSACRISLAVRWYLRYGLSYRDVEELLAERGIAVDHVTIYRWVQRSPPSSSRLHGRAVMLPVIGGLPTRHT